MRLSTMRSASSNAPVRAEVEDTLAPALRDAVGHLRAERFDEAARALRSIHERWPGQPDAQQFTGILLHTQGRSDEAIAWLRAAIDALPGEPGPRNNLGNVLLECGRIDDALAAYEDSVAVAGRHEGAADALNNIGTLRRKRGQWAQAEAACRRAVALRPAFGDAWYNLSLALMGQSRISEGLIANSKAIALWPRHLQARDQVIRALVLLGEREQAALLYSEWLAEEPDNPVVQHQLAACLGDDAPPRASDAYVERVFDAFATSFDAKLEALHYRAPQLISDALRSVLPEPAAQFDMADVGCGTGLVGPLVRPWARRLVGCDLSVGMLRKAKQRGHYDALHKAELVYYLRTQPAQFDVVVSADTLCYFGDLHEALAAAALALRSGGWLLFTVEAVAGEAADVRLNANGRYAHSQSHLRLASFAASLQVHCLDAVVLRQEAGHDVAGWLAVLHKPRP